MAKKVKSIKEVLETIKTITQDTTIEKMTPMYFDSTKLLSQPAPLYRLDSGSHRYYYRFDGEEPIFYTSVTTLIKNTLPTSPHLIKWLIDKGGDAGKDEALERAHYGTFMHQCCGELLINGKFDLDEMPKKLQQFATKENIIPKADWLENLKKDVLAFAQFMIDRNVHPLAIEVCLYHPTDGYAGAIDLACEMDFGHGRITAIVDLKSGRKGFYESHEIQLRAYQEMWQIHFPGRPIDKIFNWSPKDYRGVKPTYNLKDQSESKSIAKLPFLVGLSKIETDKREDTITIVSGKIDVTKGLEDNITEKTFVQLVKENL